MLVSKLKIQQFSRCRKIDVVIEFSARLVRRRRLSVSSGGDEIIPSIHHGTCIGLARNDLETLTCLASCQTKQWIQRATSVTIVLPNYRSGLEDWSWILSRREIGQSRSSVQSQRIRTLTSTIAVNLWLWSCSLAGWPAAASHHHRRYCFRQRQPPDGLATVSAIWLSSGYS